MGKEKVDTRKGVAVAGVPAETRPHGSGGGTVSRNVAYSRQQWVQLKCEQAQATKGAPLTQDEISAIHQQWNALNA